MLVKCYDIKMVKLQGCFSKGVPLCSWPTRKKNIHSHCATIIFFIHFLLCLFVCLFVCFFVSLFLCFFLSFSLSLFFLCFLISNFVSFFLSLFLSFYLCFFLSLFSSFLVFFFPCFLLSLFSSFLRPSNVKRKTTRVENPINLIAPMWNWNQNWKMWKDKKLKCSM